MRSMMNRVCKHIRNYFNEVVVNEGHFTISNHTISLPFCTNGDWVLIEGSKHNDGLFKYPSTTLIDEEFDGRISVRAIPEDFVEIVEDIDTYMANNPQRTGLASESFGGYSYTKESNGRGGSADWTDIYRSRLNAWRKM